VRLAAVLLVVTALALALATDASANGAPIKIPLSRLPGVVNFAKGNEARGEAQITAVEGDVTVTVVGLERLSNELYQAWLFNTKSGEQLPVSKFNVTADGTARNQSIITLGNKEFDLLVVTVEPEPDQSSNADSRIVLAGYWPGREPASVQATALAQSAGLTPPPQSTVPPGATIVSTQLPTGLPRTGGLSFPTGAVALLVLGAGAAFFLRGDRR
jgi:hypothetical protein